MQLEMVVLSFEKDNEVFPLHDLISNAIMNGKQKKNERKILSIFAVVQLIS